MRLRALPLLAVTLLVVTSTMRADPVADVKALDGTWKPIKLQILGLEAPAKNLEGTRLTITGTGYNVVAEGTTDKGTLKIDATTNPKNFDIIGVEGPNKGKTILAIWRIDGDKLQVCYNLEGTVRPTAFESTAANNWLLMTYQRTKP